MKQMKARAVGRRLMAFALCLCMIMSLISGMGLFRAVARAAEPKASSGGTSGVTRQADPSTMDTYKQMLDFSKNTRYAGRLWSDKTVFALGDETDGRDDNWDGDTLTLNMADDGVDGQSIKLDEDFLHVFSALGSSLEITGVPPVRTVIVFDNSGSMYDQTGWENTRIAKTVDAINAAIDVLMLSSEYNEVSVVLFGDGANGTDDAQEAADTHRYHGNSTAVTILPMKHYQPGEDAVEDYKGDGIIDPANNTKYLNAGRKNGDELPDGASPYQPETGKGESGWVFVDNTICELKSTHQKETDNPGHKWYDEAKNWNGWNNCGEKQYTAYQNGTTNIQAGMYQGMQELLNASKTEQVGNQTYQCVPSLVILTDGAVTDSLNNWLAPEKDTTGILNKAMGFVCDFTYKGVSFVQHNDPRGGFSDWANTAWNQFLAVKAVEGKGPDPKKSESDEADRAQKGELYYESVASADASDGKIHYVEDKWTPVSDGGNTSEEKTVTKPTDASKTAMEALANQYRDNEAYMIFNYLLTTAYYKQAVKSAYNVSSADDWSIYTITVDMPAPTAAGFHAGFDANDATKAAITSNPVMMDPGKYFDTKWLKSSGYLLKDNEGDEGNTCYNDYTVGDMTVEGIQKAIQAWEKWKTGENANNLGLTSFRSIQSGWNFYDNNVYNKIKYYDSEYKPVDQDGTNTGKSYPAPTHGSFWRVYAKQTLGAQTGQGDFYIPTKADAEKAAAAADFQLGNLSYDYATLAYYAKVSSGSGADLAHVFVEIIDAITEPLFTPVGGTNDLGVDDAVTYTDPVGKYMDVKDVKGLTLFGTYHEITRTAVYDYQWNHQYMVNKKGTETTDPLEAGWYRGEATKAAEYFKELSGTGCQSAEEAWNKGWVYRISFAAASQFVPTLKDINGPTAGADDTVTKMRNTVYTFYRLVEGDRNKLHVNPVYLADKQDETQYIQNKNVQYSADGTHLKTPGVYALSDLRIWVEDSGDYSDALGETETDTNYDEALWVNIPVNMLPLRTVSVNLGDTAEGSDDTWSYTTNIPKEGDTITAGSAESASFPLRVFYTVGVSDEALENSDRINMAGAISPEYILQNKITTVEAAAARGIAQGNVEFFSNWYNPLNRYSDYATTSTDYTFGDPVTSFSPAAGNRYYLFEKALPLYKAAYQFDGAMWKQVTINEDSTKGTLPTAFDGRLLDTLDSISSVDDIASTLNGKTPQKGDVVLVKSDLLKDVTKPQEGGGDDPFSSDSYFFLAIEFYNLTKGSDGSNVATSTQYVITRKGSEFGSAYKSSGISNGDMLVWHDLSGKYPDYPYLSATDTGDETRGRQWIGWPLDKDGYYKTCNKSSKNKTDWVPKVTDYETARNGDLSYNENWDTQHTNVLNENDTPDGAEWVLCAKPGGLRVGDLSQAVQNKGGAYVTDDNIATYYGTERYPDETSEQHLTWGFYANNVTRTANNYYLPTISTGSTSDDVRVNTYLGNNGRLYVMDTTLLVTKLVEQPNSNDLIENGDEFDYQIFINGITGPQSAVVVKYSGKNGESGSWQRQFHYIDLQLDGQLFLQTQDGQKAMVDKAGCRVIPNPNTNPAIQTAYVYAENCKSSSGTPHSAGDEYNPTQDTVNGASGPFYVFIGKNEGTTEVGGTDTAFRVYHNPEVDDNGSVEGVDVTYKGSFGSKGTFYATTVWLVSLSKYNEKWQGEGDRPDPVGSSFNIRTEEGYYDVALDGSKFELLTIDPSVDDETSALSFTTPYLTASAYWTKTVYFGYKADGVKFDESGAFDATQSTTLTETDLYDRIIPLADRPDLFTNELFGKGETTNNDNFAKYTAEFRLKNGYGLLFSGIDSGSVYRVTEKLSKKQMDVGYTLKRLSHIQQVGSTSTYMPGKQQIPVYIDDDATYGDIYPEANMPTRYRNNKTQYGLTWAVKQDGSKNEGATLHTEPFFNTNAVVWEAYSTMDKTAKGDNHHQPEGVPDGDSVFWLWHSDTNLNTNEGGQHTVLDNPNCKPLADGGCDEDISDSQVRHYFFKGGELLDQHYYGEGSGYLRDFARFVTSPTVHFAVKDEKQQVNRNPAVPDNEFTSSTNYTGVCSVYGNTGTFEESANFVNTINKDKTETQINGEPVEPSTADPDTYPGVQVGDEITYQIDWTNATNKPARVVIIDPLDDGVDFVSATDGARYFKDRDEANKYLAKIYGDPKKPVTVDSGHVVIWDLGVKSKDASGSVELTVKVNGEAEEWWDYDGDGVADAPVDPAPAPDYLVRDRATVRVADNSYNTNTVVNPVGEPEKDETQIERTDRTNVTGPDLTFTDKENADNTVVGPLVYVGDKITYTISWRNYENVPALVTVRDPLDVNVKLISASFDPTTTKGADGKPIDTASADYRGPKELVTLNAGKTTGDAKPASAQTDGQTVKIGTDDVPVIVYDAGVTGTESQYTSEGRVTWNLGMQPAGASGTVTLVVQVLSTATPVGRVDNTAYVKINGDPEQQTKTVENPTPEVHKTEETPGDGKRVEIGSTIDYTIKWNSHDTATKPDETLTTVTVVDPLDPGVDFVSASYTIPGGETVTLKAGDSDAKVESKSKVGTEDDESNTPLVTIEYNADTHTVTWTINGTPAPQEGSVTLTVKVTERALVGAEDFDDKNTGLPSNPDFDDNDKWDYRDKGGIESDGQLVQNRGAVKFNDDSYLFTELVKNPVGPEKTEEEPGDGHQVRIGDTIHYQISWQNYKDEDATVVIEDPLDVGVDFVSAVFNGTYITPGSVTATGPVTLNAGDHQANNVSHTAEEVRIPQNPGENDKIAWLIEYNETTRTVTWNLGVQAAHAKGVVDLYVKVNEHAHEYWQYDEDDTPVTDGPEDHEVVDRASVQVGNDAKVYTNIPENPVPEKTLAQVDGNPDVGTPTPSPESGDKGHGGDIDVYQSVFEGQELTYNIHWKNGTDKNADVVVTDQLDLGRNPCGVDFVSASYTIPGDETVTEKVTLKAPGRQPATSTAQGTSVSGGQPRPLVTIAYNTATRTVTWTILNQAPGAEGDVVLTVRVNANANVLHEVDNEAQVTVGNDSQYTNIVENPTEKPEKTETHIDHETGDPEDVEELTPGENDDKLHGPLVYVGDQITYQITWSNYESEEAIVTVRDPLDPNVEFVSASFDPTYTEGGDDSAKAAELKNGRTESDTKVDLSGYGGQKDIPVITYDEKTHTVTWNLGVQPARQKGTVTLVVKVLSSASPVGYVDNTAYVKVGDNPEQETDTIENPTPEVNKTETQINGEATEPSGSDPSLYPRVDVGDTITYKISWDRHEHPADEELAMVTVTDPLDPGVDFVSASYNGVTLDARTDDLSVGVHSSTWVPDDDGSEPPEGQTEKGHWSIRIFYDKATHTVTWTLYGDDALDEGYVELTVKVTTRALFDEDTDNSFNNNKENLPGGADKAGDNWDYRDKDGIESGEGGSDLTQLVQNRGAVKFGNDADIYTQLVKNPVGPEKTEVTPGDGEQVAIGDHITYEISYTNYHPAEAGKVTEQIIIRDPLDAGVDFVRAKGKAGTWVLKETAGTNWTGLTEDQKNALKNPATYMTGHDNKMPEIEAGVYYDADNHVVYWVLKADPGEKGAVTLEVKVNKDAAKEWHYGPNGDDDNGHVEGQKDYEVVDRASVQVGNDSKIYTNVVENPVPDKDEKMVEGEPVETKPKEGADDTEVGPTVKVGDQITYEIGFRNDRDVPVDIVIRDELDPGVEFVSASYGGVTAENASDRLTARSEKVTPLDGEPYWPVTVSYDRDSRTVTWTLKNVAPGAYTVALVVEVTSKAVKAGVVDNQAEVQIGNSNVKTDIVENPTPKTVKTETSPGQGMIVRPGDKVEYAISWRNHKNQKAKVVITDCLDPGVDFRSASLEGYTGDPLTFAGPDNPTEKKEATGSLTVGEATIPVTMTYDPDTHAITWTLGTKEDGSNGVPAGYEGKVTFTVVVNEEAFDKYEYDQEAKPVPGEGEDDQILNQGSVLVGNDLAYTEIVDNPLTPKKKEIAIDDVEVQVGEEGPMVKVGDIITYTITWMNDAQDENKNPIPAEVTVTDTMSKGLEFVDAGYVVFDAEGKPTYTTGKPAGYENCTVSASGQTVTWTLPGRAPNATGMVWIRARVTAEAWDEVTNTGIVKDGQHSWGLPEIKNPVESGLIIEKVVENGDTTKPWHFTVTLTAPEGKEIPWDSITWNFVGGDNSDPEVFIDPVKGTITFTLKHGEYLSLSGLPNGTHYAVVEREFNEDPYTSRVDAAHDPAEGVTKDDAQTWVRFINTRTTTPPPGPGVVELTVDKTVTGELGDKEKLWHFTVTLDDPLTGQFGDMYFTNGVAEFTLKHGQSAKATGLPAGVHYTVTEAEANTDGYVTNSQGASGTLTGSNYAHFINKLGDDEKHDNELVVEKHVTGATGETDREWHFRVELSQPLTGWYGNMYFANGVAEFTLKDGESRYATGLPAGVTYTVTEAEANRDGYTTETSGETGTIPDGGTAKAWFVNSKDETPSTEPDDTTPEPDNPPETPETGDNSQLGLWAMLMILSLAGVATTSFSLFGSAKWRIASFKGKHLRK